jgi:hypothetical protein
MRVFSDFALQRGIVDFAAIDLVAQENSVGLSRSGPLDQNRLVTQSESGEDVREVWFWNKILFRHFWLHFNENVIFKIAIVICTCLRCIETDGVAVGTHILLVPGTDGDEVFRKGEKFHTGSCNVRRKCVHLTPYVIPSAHQVSLEATPQGLGIHRVPFDQNLPTLYFQEGQVGGCIQGYQLSYKSQQISL